MKYKIFTLLLLLVPVFASAQVFTTAENILDGLGNLVSIGTPIAFGIGVLGVFVGAGIRVFSAGDEEKRKQGNQILVAGIIFVTVGLALFGIARLIQSELGIDQIDSVTPPSVNI